MDAFRKPVDITHLRIPCIGSVRGKSDETAFVQFKQLVQALSCGSNYSVLTALKIMYYTLKNLDSV